MSVATKVLTRQFGLLFVFAPKQSQRNNNTKSKQRKGGTCARVHTDIHARWCLICFVLANVSLLNRLFIFNVFTVSRNSRAKTKHVFAGHLRIVSGIGPARLLKNSPPRARLGTRPPAGNRLMISIIFMYKKHS